MTRRVLVIAFLLAPIHALWIVKSEVVWAFVHASVLSVFFNVVATLFLITLGNLWLRRRAPRLALSTSELAGLYILLSAATAVYGHDFLQVLANMLIYPYRQMEGGGAWVGAVRQHLPAWLVVTDPAELKAVWLGSANPYRWAALRAWATPLAVWLGFMMLLLWTMTCLTTLLRRQWTEHERLSFPLVRIPTEMLVHTDRLLGSRLFWAGFALAAGLDLWNAAATVWPAIPSLRLRNELQQFMTQRPWSDMGWTPLCLYPFAVGLTYFVPLDLAFASWFFYWVWKAQMIARSAVGMEPLGGAYMGDQSSGAWIGIGLVAFWGARKHLLWAVRHAFSPRSVIDDGHEPLPYRGAVLGGIGGFLGLMACARAMGLSPAVAALFLALFFVLVTAATRMRAELGPATHDLYFSGPERIMTTAAGPGAFSTQDMTVMSQFHWFTRDYRSSAMPHQLESYKLAGEAGLSTRSVVWAVLLISAWAFACWFWAYAHVMYDRGAIVRVAQPGSGWTMLAKESYTRLDQWLTAANRGPDFAVWQQFGSGLGVTLGLLAVRARIVGFPFHPVGYALAGSWTMSWLWGSVMAGWAIKGVLMRYGGQKAYRTAAPLFIGLVVGECLAGGALSLYAALTDHVTYGFFP